VDLLVLRKLSFLKRVLCFYRLIDWESKVPDQQLHQLAPSNQVQTALRQHICAVLQALPLLEEVLAETSEHGKVRRNKHIQLPDDPPLEPPTPVSLSNRPLQVIVKIVKLKLPGGNDRSFKHYLGGHWHVEGTYDERNVASACCYLDVTNVKGGDLEFRDGSDEADDVESVECETRTGRILV